MRILLLENSQTDQARVLDSLGHNGYIFDIATTVDEAFSYIGSYTYHAALVDLHLSDPPEAKPQGIDFIKRLRENRKYFPVLALTYRSDPEAEIKVFESGGNDFITKPFNVEILLLHLAAHIFAFYQVPLLHPTRIERGPISVHLYTAEVRVNGKQVRLAKHPFRLLKYLLSINGTATNSQIIENVWDVQRQDGKDHGDVETLIYNLRKAIDPEGLFHPIEHVPALGGYRVRNMGAEEYGEGDS